MRKTLGKRIANFALAMAVAVTVFASAGVQAFAYTQTTGTVISDNVKVRSDASTTAKQVSSLKNGDVVDIVDEATDSSGYVWYKIYVNKSEFGYVRSDLVNKKGGSSSNTTATATASTDSAASLPETQATATEQRNATALADSVNVRKGAGTAYESVGKVSKGGSLVITGEANGTDGKTWYQVSFGDGQTGFVRSDLVAVSDTPVEAVENPEGENPEGENAEGGEGENAEGQESTPDTTTGDGAYSLMYSTDEEGNGVWYLYDNFGGYRVKVKELIEAAQSADAVNTLRKSVSTYKKIAIALGILAAILVAGVVVLALKLRDSLYYEDDEEEEYDRYSTKRPSRDENPRNARTSDNERPERPFRRNTDADVPRRDVDGERPTRRNAEERTVRPTRRNPEDEYEKRPVRRPSEDERPSRREHDDVDVERPARGQLREAEERQARRQEARRDDERAAAPKRKARNFVGDEDDFEFEFLDLDDEK